MNNFPAMTEVQRQELIELCEAVISSLLQYGEYTSLECNVYRIALAALTAEPEYHTMVGNYYTSPPAPVLRVPEWTNEQCLEFLSIAFRHAEISGDIEMDDIRLGIKMVNAAAPEVE